VALLEHTFRWRHTHSTQCIRASARRLCVVCRWNFRECTRGRLRLVTRERRSSRVNRPADIRRWCTWRVRTALETATTRRTAAHLNGLGHWMQTKSPSWKI